METLAVLFAGPKSLSLETLALSEPGPEDIVVEITHSGISTGTERLFWQGTMPDFPGMGYPLVPGYEAVGEVVGAGSDSGFQAGERVFVPGAKCFENAKSLFGASARRVVTAADRVTRINEKIGREGLLLALAATAQHAISVPSVQLPELIVGHGVLGRLLARLTIGAGGPPPVVWEIDPERGSEVEEYTVCRPEDDPRRDYNSIYDASGSVALLDDIIKRLNKGGEIVLSGFYTKPISFAFPPAFMREVRIRVSAEWNEEDMQRTYEQVEGDRLSLNGLITHELPASDAARAYPAAFDDSACLKMVLDWREVN